MGPENEAKSGLKYFSSIFCAKGVSVADFQPFEERVHVSPSDRVFQFYVV